MNIAKAEVDVRRRAEKQDQFLEHRIRNSESSSCIIQDLFLDKCHLKDYNRSIRHEHDNKGMVTVLRDVDITEVEVID